MRFFQYFPRVNYRSIEFVDGQPQLLSRSVPNMTVKLAMNIFDDVNLSYLTYRIKDRDRPDTVSVQLYGSSRYAWVVMLANNMRDTYDWPLDDREFSDYMNRKYESADGVRDGVAQSKSTVSRYVWVRTDGQELDVDAVYYATLPSAETRSETVYDVEYAANDTRRYIRLPTFESLETVVRQFNAAVSVS